MMTRTGWTKEASLALDLEYLRQWVDYGRLMNENVKELNIEYVDTLLEAIDDLRSQLAKTT